MAARFSAVSATSAPLPTRYPARCRGPFQQGDGQIQGLPLVLGIPARHDEPVLRPPQDKSFVTLLAGLSEGAGHGERKA
jgi:hypothetical protein